MASSIKLKCTKLEEDASFADFCEWQSTILQCLIDIQDYKYFLTPSTVDKPNLDATWLPIGDNHQTRGLVDDSTKDKEGKVTVTRYASTKLDDLKRMLKLISAKCSHYLEVDITRDSTCIEDIWSFVRNYHNFEQSEASLIDFYEIVREDGERPQRLYRRLRAHIADNLLVKNGSIEHNGKKPDKNEDLSWTLERVIVLHWLKLLHPALPKHVKRVYATDLQRKSLKDLQPAFCLAIDPMIEEIESAEARVNFSKSQGQGQGKFRTTGRRDNRPSRNNNSYGKFPSQSDPVLEPCQLCRAEKRRYDNHDLARCDYISKAQKRAMVRAYGVSIQDESSNEVEVDQIHLSDDNE